MINPQRCSAECISTFVEFVVLKKHSGKGEYQTFDLIHTAPSRLPCEIGLHYRRQHRSWQTIGLL